MNNQLEIFNTQVKIKFPNGQIGLIKSWHGDSVVMAFVLDGDGKKIPDGYNIHGDKSFKIGISAGFKLITR